MSVPTINKFKPIRLSHNYYNDFLEFLKWKMSDVFENEIRGFQFNFASKQMAFHNLYKNPDIELPKCVFNVNNVDVDQAVNNLTYRNNNISNTFDLKFCINETKKEEINCSFRWVKINTEIKIFYENGADVLTSLDLFNQLFPRNFTYYYGDYKTFIPIDKITNIDIKDKILGNFTWRVSNTGNEIQPYIFYNVSPRFKITNVQANINNSEVNTRNKKFFLAIQLETELQIPNLLKIENSSGEIKEILMTVKTTDENPLKPDIFGTSEEFITRLTNNYNNILYTIEMEDHNFEEDSIKLEDSLEPYLRDNNFMIYFKDNYIDFDSLITNNNYKIENGFIYLPIPNGMKNIYQKAILENLNSKIIIMKNK